MYRNREKFIRVVAIVLVVALVLGVLAAVAGTVAS